ncbi:MarR family winged helix-turn-helix transcriptional regulator [Qaidamihabitans albus]|uniref:MarR family winged helix-turn-helix transcriptional regulator n=1 Tax=Qaidamihabitans albus TaxID=2795733 RepID=UPI0018F19D6C|nr:MarR family transcriptional regulator [Qaidamihabitans albus]
MIATRNEPLVSLLSRVARDLQTELTDLLAPYDVSVDQWRILDVLGDGQGRPMGELAGATFLHGPTLTKACDRLIERGLLYRRPDELDRRRVIVDISHDGRRLLRTLTSHVVAQQQRLEADLGTQQAALVDALRCLDPLTVESRME